VLSESPLQDQVFEGGQRYEGDFPAQRKHLKNHMAAPAPASP